VLAASATPGVRVLGAPRTAAARRLRPVPPAAVRGGRAARVIETLRRLAAGPRPTGARSVAALGADHVLQLDLRDVEAFHHGGGADVTLIGLPVPFGEREPRTLVRAGRDRRALPAADAGGDALSWAGDLVASTAALPALLAALPPEAPRDDAVVLARMTEGLRVVVYDASGGGLPGVGRPHGAYWHEPVSIEAYYAAQMDLCGSRPGLDLFNAAWPLPTPARAFGPARLAVDATGRPGQAINCLVADGAAIRGGTVVNSMLGAGAVVESGAEVDDSLLLDGCQVGAHARVRRTVLAPGACVPAGATLGFGDVPPWAQERASGLLVVAATPAESRRGAVAR
jgi:glucose-1-phosphate adenylyltransferase